MKIEIRNAALLTTLLLALSCSSVYEPNVNQAGIDQERYRIDLANCRYDLRMIDPAIDVAIRYSGDPGYYPHQKRYIDECLIAKGYAVGPELGPKWPSWLVFPNGIPDEDD